MVKGDIHPLSKEEMNALIEAAMEDDFYYMFYNVAKTTGRRLGEYYNVQVKDLDLDKGIMVTRVLKKRRHAEKEAILIPNVVALIKQYLNKHNLQLDDYLFRKVGYRQHQNKIKYFARKAGITKNVSFHNFRHYFITELFRKGWDYSKIAKLTGHTSVGTLAVYDHAVAEDIRDDALKDVGDI